MSSFFWPPEGGSGGGVTSLNAETGDIILVAGTGITITPSGQNITIASTDIAAAITSINLDTTAAQTLTVGTAGVNFAIVDAGSGSHVFNLPTASATNRGALSSADWSTFNAKQAALTIGNLTDAGTDGITVGNGSGAVIGTGTTISQQVADTTHNGYLSSTDWNTFNGKGAGTVTAVSVASSNGFSGSSSGGATPALTLSTTLTTPVIAGNGTALIAGTTTGTGSTVVLATSPTLVTPVIGAATGTSLSVSGQLTSTVATGTAPLVVSSTTQVANLNAATAGSATTATTATNIAGGIASEIPYQTGAGATSFIANGTSGQFLESQGASAPIWSTPTITLTAPNIQVLTFNNTTFTGKVTSGSATVTTVSSFTGLYVGMGVSASADVTAGSYILSMNTGASTLVLSAAATGGSATTVTFTPYNSGSGYTSGTYVTPTSPSPLYLEVTAVAGGGGGGGTSGSVTAGGGGGGGGATSITYITSPSATYAFQVGGPGGGSSTVGGTGGTSSFGSSLCTSVGGNGGGQSTNTTGQGPGGAGGASSFATIPIVGQGGAAGGAGVSGVLNGAGGLGGSSSLGGGGYGPGAGGTGGTAGGSYGGGGSGGSGGGASSGAGGPGVVIVKAIYQ